MCLLAMGKRLVVCGSRNRRRSEKVAETDSFQVSCELIFNRGSADGTVVCGLLWRLPAGISIGKHFKKTVAKAPDLVAISPIEIIFPLTIG